jgi:hypothetical protein
MVLILAILPIVLIRYGVVHDILGQHLAPLLHGIDRIHRAKPGAHGILLLKSIMVQEFPGLFVQDQIRLGAVMPSNNYRTGHSDHTS